MRRTNALAQSGLLAAALLTTGCGVVTGPDPGASTSATAVESAGAQSTSGSGIAPEGSRTTDPLSGPATTPTAEPKAAFGLTTTATVSHVVDGDTIVTSRGRVRIIGIDTPERGICGFGPATSKLQRLTPVGSRVTLTRAAGRDDQDRYGRYLRYVSLDGVDAGGALIRAGLADARYDSRDGYGWHPKEDSYVRWDEQYSDKYSYDNCPSTDGAAARSAADGTYYASCTAARLAGAAPVRRGDPGYGPHLDRDGDGVACE